MGALGILLLAALIFVLGNLVILPLWLAATSLAGALSTPGRFLVAVGDRRVRQNHALEHATLNVLEEHHGPQRLSGVSREEGFVIKGLGSPESIRAAAEEGLARLKRGETRLAIHKGCGTSIAAANLVVSVVMLILLIGLGRFSLLTVVMAMVFANLAGPLAGRLFQRFLTTSPPVGDLAIVGFDCQVGRGGFLRFMVNPSEAGVPVVCFIRTAALRSRDG